ncbi:YlaH-like family protein [Ureibacillus thermophilus]|uniref:YlaH-like protein n=1 Tax=Ureibacillus thermophilus TaxID=367743 RepID=A0A4P6UTN9_9BACL|nr:hypothetical protein DKZ56_06325 [Ureibacillus thermophilus]
MKLFSLILASAPISDTDRVFNRMSAVTRYVYENAPNNQVAGYIIFFLVFILSAIVYKLGFAKKLSVGKNIIIYIFLFLGCILLTFFALFLPMIEGLIVAALVLILYKIRLWREKKEEKEAS